MSKYIEISEFIGKTFSDIVNSGDEIVFHEAGETGRKWIMLHDQDCCESVTVEDIAGDLNDLVGSPIVQAEEVRDSGAHPADKTFDYEPESFTWTFYKLATVKGRVTIRWFGQSNGYYSESVSTMEAQS